MEYCTRNPALKKPGYGDAADIVDINDNMDVIDGIIAKGNFNAAVDPTINDDSGDGYAIGSVWINTTDNVIFIAESVTVGAAVWNQIYPALPLWSMNETPSGTINGVNVTFTLANTPSNQIALYLNGQYMVPGAGEDYTLSGSTITMAAAPVVGDKIRACYQY
jgi:hypothetical protein